MKWDVKQIKHNNKVLLHHTPPKKPTKKPGYIRYCINDEKNEHTLMGDLQTFPDPGSDSF